MPGGTSGEVMPTSSGSEAAAQEASQVNRHRFSVLRQELQASRNAPKSIGDQLRSEAAAQEASQVNRHGFTVLRQELQARRKAPKIIGGRKAGEDHARSQCPLRGETKDRVRRAGCEKRVLKSKMLNQVQHDEMYTFLTTSHEQSDSHN